MENDNKVNEFQKKVDLYLDHALNDSDQKIMMEQIRANPEYPQLINKERNFRTFIKNNVKRSSVSTDLIQSIIDSIKLV